MTERTVPNFGKAIRTIALAVALGGLAAGFVGQHAHADGYEDGVVRFGVPPWPGVTVKSEVAAQLLAPLGYETNQRNVGLSFVYEGLSKGQLDVFLANWSPSQDQKVASYLDSGKLVRLTKNIDDALWGIAVPTYVYEAGVTELADLEKHADKFDHKIHGIEPGSGVNQQYSTAIDNDTAGLGDWELIASSTSGMLSAVERATRRDEWIVFNGWKPHWMFAVHDLRIIADTGDTGLTDKRTDVYTLVPSGFADQAPNLARFFRQFEVGSAIQSQWIYAYGYQDKPAPEVAEAWIRDNMDKVAEWLDGVETRDGDPAIDAVRAAFQG